MRAILAAQCPSRRDGSLHDGRTVGELATPLGPPARLGPAPADCGAPVDEALEGRRMHWALIVDHHSATYRWRWPPARPG